MEVKLIPSKPFHFEYLARHLRERDAEEIRNIGKDPYEAVMKSQHVSKVAWTGFLNGEIACIFGTAPLGVIGKTGMVWFLGTHHMESVEAKKAFLKYCHEAAEVMMADYDVLTNMVDSEYDESIRWLKWMGCTFSSPILIPETGKYFLKFRLERKHV